MESTSIYWKSVFEALEDKDILTWLVNARHVKSVPGRKTDVQDSEWLADLGRHGLLQPSFIPPADFRELRMISRYRRKLVGYLSAEKNRLHKLLDSCGFRLGCVVSDINGVSAKEMIAALIEGGSKPEEIAELARGRLKKKHDQLVLSLEAKLTDRPRSLLRRILNHMNALEMEIFLIECQVVAALEPYREQWQLLQTIPGISEICAAMLLTEIGVDMSRFGNQDRFSSWLGLCPGNNESAGKRKSGRTRRGNVYARQLLIEAAHSAVKTKSHFKGVYESLVIRRGKKRSIVAVAHKMAKVVYIILHKKEPYKDPGINYEELRVKRNAPRWIKALKRYGYLPQTA